MAIVPYVTADDLDEQDRALLTRPINLFRALANSPAGFTKFHAFAEWIRWDCELDGRQRELIILAVGYLNCSPYEFSHHVALSAEHFGVTDPDVSALIDYLEGRESALQPLDRLVIESSVQLTKSRRLDDATAEALTAALPSGRVVDVVLVASFYNMVVRVLGGLRVDNEPDYQTHLDRFPLPNGAREVG